MDENAHETTERRLENLIFYHFDIQNKFVYYILAINAACIAFTINFAKDVNITCHEIPLGFAILFWGISFYSGIVQVENTEVSIQANIKKLEAASKGQEPSDYIKSESNRTIKKGVKYRKYQNWCILIGALCFIIWYVLRKV